MNERLKIFLQQENLTPARFAEIMNIQRSGISHLLSGRNKPSYEFIQKMMTAFPNINMEWLILGKGSLYKSDSQSEVTMGPSPQPSIAESVHFDLFSGMNQEDEIIDESIDLKEDTPYSNSSEPSENRIFDNNTYGGRKIINSGRKKIERITIFYADGTFDEH